MKKNSLFIFILSFLFLFSTSLWAQEEEVSSEETSEDSTSYESSNASEFEDDEDYAEAYQRYQEQKTSSDLIASERLRNWSDAVTIGLKAGLGSPTFLGDQGNGWSFGLAVNLGAIMKIRITDYFALTPELTASYRNLSREINENDAYTVETSLSNIVIEIPILLRFALDNTEGLYAFTGPEIGLVVYNNSSEEVTFNNSSEEVTFETSSSPTTEELDPIESSSVEIGFVLGVGYQVNRWLGLDLRAFYSFTNYSNETLSTDDYKNINTLFFQFSASYFF